MDDFSSLFDFMPIGAYRAAADGTQLRANPALVRITGARTEEEHLSFAAELGDHWYVEPGRRQQFQDRLLREGAVIGFESEVYRQALGGERIWVREHAHVVRNPDGSVRYYEGTVEEITDRVNERKALQHSQEQLEQVVRLVPGVVYRIRIAADGTRRYTYVSEHVRDLYGLEPEAVMADGHALTRLRHPEDAAEVQRKLEQVIASEESLNYQVRVQLLDGTQKWIQTISAAAPAPTGERARVGVLFDITELKRAEAQVRAQADLWKNALEATGDGVWDWRVQDGVEILSPQCKALYGFEPHELPDTPDALDALTHPDDLDRMREDRDAHFDGRSARYVNEHRVRCKNGEWKWILSRGLVISRDAAGQPLRMVGTHTDITAAKLAEALRVERDRAAAADVAKSQFLSRVSHELRTPLNAILGFAQLLELDPGDGERQQGWNRQVLASGRHLLALMDDILDLSSAETGHMTVLQEPVPLRAVVEEAWAMVHSGANELDVQLLDELPAGHTEQVRADRKRVKQIVSNLLSNAVKYNRAQGWVRVSLGRVGMQWALVVSDSGLGLDTAQQARLFNPFDRLGAERGPVQGTGLGLALSRQLAHAMGGEIDVSSTPGLGSSFTLRLPAA